MKLSILSSALCILGGAVRLTSSAGILSPHRRSLNVCQIVDVVVADLHKYAPEATAFCSTLLKLPSVTPTALTTQVTAITTDVTVAGPGPVTTTTLPTVTVTITSTEIDVSTQSNIVLDTIQSTEIDSATATATVTSLDLVIGTIPAYLTAGAPKMKRANPSIPAQFKAWGLSALSTACSCLSLSGPATKTVTVIATATIQVTTTTAGPQTTIIQTPATETALATTLTTATSTTQVTTTIISETALTNTASVTTTVTATQTQLPIALCSDLSNAFVDYGINLDIGESNSNNFGNYSPESCCQLCFDTPGCYMSYIAGEDCYLYYFGGSPTTEVCPTIVTMSPVRTLPPGHYVIPGPCASLNGS